MATINKAVGLQPITNSTLVSEIVGPYLVPNTLASVCRGTPLTLGGTANTTRNINGYVFGLSSLPTVAIATGGDGNKLLGSLTTAFFNPANFNSSSAGSVIPASTTAVIEVANDPDQLFLCAASGVLPATSIGLNANLIIGTVDPITGYDSTVFDSSTAATTATFQIKIIKAADMPGNDTTLPNALYVVKINNHVYPNVTAGV